MNLNTARNSHLRKRRTAPAIGLSMRIVGLPPLCLGEHRAQLLDRERHRERRLLEPLGEHAVEVHVERLADLADGGALGVGVDRQSASLVLSC